MAERFVSLADWTAHSFVARQSNRPTRSPPTTIGSSAPISSAAAVVPPASTLSRSEHAEFVRLAQKARRFGAAALSESERVALFQHAAAVEAEQTQFFQLARLGATAWRVDARLAALVHAICAARVRLSLQNLAVDAVLAPLRPSGSGVRFPLHAAEEAVPHHLQLERLVFVAGASPAMPRFAVPAAGTLLAAAQLDHELVAARFAPVHCDDDAVRLAAEHDVDVVVDALALVSLFGGAALADRLSDDALNSATLDAILAPQTAAASEWRALTVVRERRAYVSAPLPPATLTARETNALFFAEVLRPAGAAVRFDLWVFGALRVLVRTPVPPALNDGRPVSLHVQVLRGADDAVPCDLRSECAERLMAQWLLRGAVPADDQMPVSVVVRVQADTGAVHSSTTTHELTQLQQHQYQPFTALPPDELAFRWRAVGAVLAGVHQLAAGTYLLRRRAAEPIVNVWRCESAKAAGPTFPVATIVDAGVAAREAVAANDAVAAPSLAELLADVGALNERVEYVPPQWTDRMRAPFTFADGGKAAAAAATSGGDDGKAKHAVFEHVRYCHAFALHSACKDGAQCRYPHLTQAEAAAKAAELSSALVPGVRYCHAFAAHGRCKDGGECKFPHLTQAEAEARSATAHSGKRKKAPNGKPNSGGKKASRQSAPPPPRLPPPLLNNGQYDDMDSTKRSAIEY